MTQTTTTDTKDFDAALAKFVAYVQQIVDEACAPVTQYQISVMAGRKYVRIVRTGPGRGCYLNSNAFETRNACSSKPRDFSQR